MKTLWLVLLSIFILGALPPSAAPAADPETPLKLVIDSGMSQYHAEALIDLFIWINENVPQHIEDSVREHEISVFILNFPGTGVAGADFDDNGIEPVYTIVVDPQFFRLSLPSQKSILLHEFEHLNLYSLGYRSRDEATRPCRVAFHEIAALGVELQYAVKTGMVDTPRYEWTQLDLANAKEYWKMNCGDSEYKQK